MSAKKKPVPTKTKRSGTSRPSKKLELRLEGIPSNLKPAWQEMVNHVYHFPQRLVVDKAEPIKTITGEVTEKTPEPDGDWHIKVHIGMGNELECEIICAHSPVTQKDAIPYCANYKNNVTVPNGSMCPLLITGRKRAQWR